MAGHLCHRCGSRHLRRSRRKNWIEHLVLPLFLIRPYRCDDCHARQYGIGFHRFRRQVTNAGLVIVVLLAALAGIASLIYIVLTAMLRF